MLAGGVAAGVLDIVYAFALSAMAGRNPIGAVQSVAAGVLGREAYQGGMETAAIGLALHIGILVVAALVYLLIAQRVKLVRRHWVIAGAVFGVGVYLFMNFVVLPLSAVPFKLTYPPEVLLQGFVSHALLVGLPIAWCVRKWGP